MLVPDVCVSHLVARLQAGGGHRTHQDMRASSQYDGSRLVKHCESSSKNKF